MPRPTPMYTDFEAADDRNGRVLPPLTATLHFPIYNSMSLKPFDSDEHVNFMAQLTGRAKFNIENDCPMTACQDDEYAFAALPKLSDKEWDSMNAYTGEDDIFETSSLYNVNQGRLYFED